MACVKNEAKPVGRESLAAALMGLAEELDGVRIRSRKLGEYLALKSPAPDHPRRPELVDLCRVGLDGAIRYHHDLALAVRAGFFDVVGLENLAPPAPLLDLVEQRGPDVEAAPAPAPPAEIPPAARPSTRIASAVAAGPMTREPAILSGGAARMPEAVPVGPDDGRSRFVALNAFKKPVVAVRAFSRVAAEAAVKAAHPHKSLEVVEDPDGLGSSPGVEQLVAALVDEDLDFVPDGLAPPLEFAEDPVDLPDLNAPGGPDWHPADPVVGRDPGPISYDVLVRFARARGPLAAAWVGRVMAKGPAQAEGVVRRMLGEPSAGDAFEVHPAGDAPGRAFDRKVADAGGFRAIDVDGEEVLACLGSLPSAVEANPPTKPAELFPDKPFDVMVQGLGKGGGKGLGEWVARIWAGGFADAEIKAASILVPAAPGWRYNAIGSKPAPAIATAMARSGGFVDWFDADCGTVRACVALNWRELVGVPEHFQARPGHDRLRLRPDHQAPATVEVAPFPVEPVEDPWDFFDVVADGVGAGGRHRLWVARIQAPSAEEAEHFAGELIGPPTPPIAYLAKPEHEDFEGAAERAGIKDCHADDSAGRLTPIRAALSRDAKDVVRPRAAAAPEGGPEAEPEKLGTDELLMIAAHRRPGMAERWDQLRKDGASDSEVKAALGRAFGLGEEEIGGQASRGGVLTEPGGVCSFEGGESPKFWAGKTNWWGRPTLESKALVERARRVLEIPGEDGAAPPAKVATPRKRRAADVA